MKNKEHVIISRNAQKHVLKSDNLTQNTSAQSSDISGPNETFNRRDVLKNLVPSVAKSLGQALRNFKVGTFEVLDKIEKK